MKLILFGGTFDPPHNGHMRLLRCAIEAVQPDGVLVMPTGIPPHKAFEGAAAALRMEMCACFAPLFPGLEVSALEILRKGKSYTIDTVNALLEQYPGTEIYLPMGSDMLLYFRKWSRWQQLAKHVTLVALCRAQADAKALQADVSSLAAQGVRVKMAHGEMLTISSTEVRRRVACGQSIETLVPACVAQVIQREKLYAATQREALGVPIDKTGQR